MLLMFLVLGCGGGKGTTPAGDTPAEADADADADTDTDTDTDAAGGRTHPDSIWLQRIDGEPPDSSSEAVIANLAAHGWGLGRAQIDFSFEVFEADSSTPRRTFTPTSDFYSPDCDQVAVPVPADARLEGESGLRCVSDGDCHLIVLEREEHRLYEMWRANILDETTFQGGCLAVWETDRLYGPEGRGEQCTSADAAGYPIAPLLVTSDEVASGEIRHALRFILPNSAIRAGEYVHPATHSTGAASGGPAAPPYGARLRLRADFPLETLPNDASRTVAVALQRYGMFLADGGNVLFTFQNDTTNTAKWSDLLESRDLEGIQVTDFEVMPLGTPIELTYDCVRVE